MALDGSYDEADGPGEAKPERQLHAERQLHGGTGGDAHAARAGPVEHRSRSEYYAALRAADGEPVPANDSNSEAADSRPDSSGWDGIDAKDRPPLDTLRVTPERGKHILDGDATDSGGHRHGTGNPGKTEFPASWDDKKIIDNILDVARRPDEPPIYQDWNKRWLALGKRDDVEVVVVIAGDARVWSGWPLYGGPGVVRNPKENDG